MTLRMGVDIGGTFTDFALLDGARRKIAAYKQLTTPQDPSLSVLDGVGRLLRLRDVAIADLDGIVHGTTLVTNAVIERKGAVTGLLCTAGHADVLDIGLERRYDVYDLRIEFPSPIVPRANRRELSERIRYDGAVLRPLAEAEVTQAVKELREQGVEALAVCLMHSYAHPQHEQRVRDIIATAYPELQVSISSDVAPFMREYERWNTTAMNAYTQPMFDRYLARLEEGLAALGFRGQLHIMASNGGTVSVSMARKFPVRAIESGPAAGALMSTEHGVSLGLKDLLSFDMGGTTAKGALVRNGVPLKRHEMEVARLHGFKQGSGLPVRIPVIDMIEIGSGGGSLAGIDARGVLRVGPESAGAMPGPACYGQGGTGATLTDANLILGYLDDKSFLGGTMNLDRAAAERAMEASLTKSLGLDAVHVAFGIHETINEDVARAFRIHASERGFDYRRCSMVAFGGSGPLHALRIAKKLKIPRAVFPVGAGVMSAFGLLASPLSFEILRSHRVRADTMSGAELESRFRPLIEETREPLLRAGVARNDVRIIRKLDMRYRGQGYEVEVVLPDEPDPDRLIASLSDLFRAAYEQVFSMSFLNEPLEIINWKVEALGPTPGLGGATLDALPNSSADRPRSRPAYFAEAGGFVDTPIYDRYALKPGVEITGPALIEERESTCVVGVGDRVTVDEHFNLIAEILLEEPSDA